jgi:signal transduction histidine kinase
MESESLSELSWSQLVQRLRTLEDRNAEEERVVHDLHVHQVELEMQNRELREAQQRLEASRARYAELYDQAPIGYLTLDESATIVEINLTGALLLGRERENLIGAPFVATAGVRNPGAFFAHLRECASGRASTADIEIATPKGPLAVQLTTKANIGAGGRVHGCRMSMSDVTERRRSESEKLALLENERRARAEADTANQMKDQFLGIVSHELRTPLNAILGWTQILGARSGEPDLFPRGLAVMQRNGELLARIVDDILDVSRIVSGKLRIVMKKIALDETVTSALEQARAAAESKRITMRSNIAPNCKVTGDAQRLQQVVSNLLSNAIKFTKDEGHVDVTLERNGNGFRITVRDDGCGIDPGDLPHVFEHFRQSDSSTTRTHAGLGLGLAIAHHIVEAHGGTIEGESYGRGRGATFTVTLPSRPYSIPPSGTDAAGAAVRSEAREQGSVAGIRVLWVDDEKDGLEVAALMLGTLGAEVRTATSVDEAIGTLSSFMPDVIVSDIAMPDQDGYDLIRHVRALPPPASELPAIAVTAYARADDADRAVRAGFTCHLAKPVDAEVLADVISTLVPS